MQDARVPRMSRPSSIPAIGQGRPSAVRSARPGPAVILGGGCALLVVLAGIAALVAYLVTGAAPIDLGASGRAEVRDLRAIRGRSGSLTMIGEIANVGDAPIGAPEAKLVLFDGRKAPLGAASCAPPIRLLAPREKVPCAFSFGAVGPYAAMDLRAKASPVLGGVEPAKLTVTGVALNQTGAGAELSGTVQNAGAFAARRVVLLGAFYGADGKIVGQAQGSAGDLAPGATATFRASTADLAAPAQTFVVRAFGYRE